MDDITVWVSGVKKSELEQKVNTYFPVLMGKLAFDISTKVISNLVYADQTQANVRIHPKIKIADAELALIRSPTILGVYLDTFYSFNNHCVQVANK